jgi:hypothetical protein
MAAIKKWNGSAWEETYPKTTAGNIVATGTPSASTFLRGDGAWATTPQGTVTSVGLSLPTSVFTGTGSVTTSGTLTRTFANQNANTIFAGPTTGLPGIPAFRTLVAEDLPAHTHGNITNAGAIGTTANLAVITTTSGVLTTASRSGIDTRTSFPPDAHGHTIFDVADLTTELAAKEPAFTKNTGFNKNFGTTAGTVSEGNHTHAASAITSGTLAVAQGGTGQTTLALARNAMGLGNTTGALPILNGGTGASTAPTQWGIIHAASTTSYASTAAGSFGQILRSNSTSAPTWTDSFVNISNFTAPIASNGTTGVTLNVNESIAIGNKYAIEVSDDATSTNNRMLLFWTQQTSSSTSAAAGQTFTFTARTISTTTTITYKFVIYRTGATSFGIINAYTHTLGTGSSHPIATTTAIRVWRIFRVV